jgi:hypothetical protein
MIYVGHITFDFCRHLKFYLTMEGQNPQSDPQQPNVPSSSMTSVGENYDQASRDAGWIAWDNVAQRPVSPCVEFYGKSGSNRPPTPASRQNLPYTLYANASPKDSKPSPSQKLSDDMTIYVSSLPVANEKVPHGARNLVDDKVASEIQHAFTPPKEEKKPQKEKKPKDPKAHMSLLSLDNIHTVSILCWRRGRKAYLATSGAPEQYEDEDEDDGNWHITETVLFSLYRFVGYFVLVAQFTFLWSLLDLYASDFADSDSKRKSFPIKYTASMTDRDFGTGPLNATIAAWDAARPAANVRQCQEWVLECGTRWAAREACKREADISSNCPPWDYEKYLKGRNGTEPICYRSDGAAVHGGSPYYGSMTKGVILEWVFGCVTPSEKRSLGICRSEERPPH